MRTLTRMALAAALSIPLMGAGAGAAEARETTRTTLTLGTGGVSVETVRHDHRHDRRYRALSPRDIRAHLRRSFYEVKQPERRGDIYITRAEDRRGRDVRVTSDAYTGQVIDVNYLRRDHDRRDDRRDRDWRDSRWR